MSYGRLSVEEQSEQCSDFPVGMDKRRRMMIEADQRREEARIANLRNWEEVDAVTHMRLIVTKNNRDQLNQQKLEKFHVNVRGHHAEVWEARAQRHHEGEQFSEAYENVLEHKMSVCETRKSSLKEQEDMIRRHVNAGRQQRFDKARAKQIKAEQEAEIKRKRSVEKKHGIKLPPLPGERHDSKQKISSDGLVSRLYPKEQIERMKLGPQSSSAQDYYDVESRRSSGGVESDAAARAALAVASRRQSLNLGTGVSGGGGGRERSVRSSAGSTYNLDGIYGGPPQRSQQQSWYTGQHHQQQQQHQIQHTAAPSIDRQVPQHPLVSYSSGGWDGEAWGQPIQQTNMPLHELLKKVPPAHKFEGNGLRPVGSTSPPPPTGVEPGATTTKLHSNDGQVVAVDSKFSSPPGPHGGAGQQVAKPHDHGGQIKRGTTKERGSVMTKASPRGEAPSSVPVYDILDDPLSNLSTVVSTIDHIMATAPSSKADPPQWSCDL